MHVKKMRLKNVKSFKSETELRFSEGVNVIIGKNGSGKSSIVSALRFAMCAEDRNVEQNSDFIHEGNAISEEEAEVEIVFCESMEEETMEREISIRRTIGMKKDEYFVNGKVVSREEYVGFLHENGILTGSSTYFIVAQGEVAALATLRDKDRHKLLKDVCGVACYEKDRETSIRELEDTKQNETRIRLMIGRIDEKLRSLENDKKEVELCNALENERRRLEYGYIEREVREINDEILRVESLIANECRECSDDEDDYVIEAKEIEDRIKILVDARKRLSIDPRYNEKTKYIEKGICNLEEKRNKLKERHSTEEEQFLKFKEEEAQNFIRSVCVRHFIGFLGTLMNKKISLEEVEVAKAALCNKMNEMEKSREGVSSRKVVDMKRDLENMVERRKYLWREEKRLELSKKSIDEMVKLHESKLFQIVDTRADIYESMREFNGVLGYVYDLVSIPDELLNAFEAVAGNSLFNVVVRDEEVASMLLKKIEGMKFRITFMPLNRIELKDANEIKDPMVISLASKIRCEPRYRALFRHITHDAYFCSDLKQGVYVSKKYKINVVTISGDVISKDGPISGGYEKKSGALREYKRICKELRKHGDDYGKIKQEIKNIGREIDEMKLLIDCGDVENRTSEVLSGTVEFLDEKVKMLTKMVGMSSEDCRTEICKRLERLRTDEKEILMKSNWFMVEIGKMGLRLREAETEMKKINDAIKRLEENLSKSKMYDEALRIDEKIADLREKEKIIREKIFDQENDDVIVDAKRVNVETEVLMRKKHVLIGKRNELCMKIGATDFRNLECLYPEKSKEEFVSEISRINERIRGFCMINKKSVSQWEDYSSQRDLIKKKLDELGYDREKIFELICELDLKKEKTMKLALSEVKRVFSEIYSKLTDGKIGELIDTTEGLGVKIDGLTDEVNLLSGGQKVVIALCLMFSMQRVYKSPFYVFDEIDANLDSQVRERVCMMIKEMNECHKYQFIIASFRKETLVCGDRYFSVEFKEKKSSVVEVPKETAYEFLNDGPNETKIY
ncbi:structural maintenance of chromosomes protein [Ordospora colligata]|uniref:Structural maintenance of chromosomes protein n=1 Tax=Ordospora colligata OC4 TaxID=1354746 RepID=A0A0B2UIX2_9MICR|nr:structural maintenance of chromosomes protein [Ordospora colligata OC4]KHN69007.1 structural maintenance of chromosomes protein [Ordospora colligata OC4]TBU14235.1 structural maintenance of chromosomes protein [Ordospora colligata]TBU14282.1 structural maintenance of chromosomes protein [Ordospora colligata]TBU17912.1 structural maintenance of chromosomes protein [Ordospora colligata]